MRDDRGQRAVGRPVEEGERADHPNPAPFDRHHRADLAAADHRIATTIAGLGDRGIFYRPGIAGGQAACREAPVVVEVENDLAQLRRQAPLRGAQPGASFEFDRGRALAGKFVVGGSRRRRSIPGRRSGRSRRWKRRPRTRPDSRPGGTERVLFGGVASWLPKPKSASGPSSARPALVREVLGVGCRAGWASSTHARSSRPARPCSGGPWPTTSAARHTSSGA